MRKKGFTVLEAIVRIVLAIMLLVAVSVMASKCYRGIKGGVGTESFEGLVGRINEVKGLGEGDSKTMTLGMDEETFIALFGKDDEMVILKWYKPVIHNNFIFSRPGSSECREGACACLCKSGSFEYQKKTLREYNQTVTCNDFVCSNLGSLSFKGACFDVSSSDSSIKYEGCEKGVVIERSFIWVEEHVIHEEQLRSITIEKGAGDLIKICEKAPCGEIS